MVKVEKLGVLSFAKVYAFLMGLLGLVIGLMISFVTLIIGSVSNFNGTSGLGMGLLTGFGLLSIIILPILYAAFGFVTGALSALLYNFVARFTGGFEVELKK